MREHCGYPRKAASADSKFYWMVILNVHGASDTVESGHALEIQ